MTLLQYLNYIKYSSLASDSVKKLPMAAKNFGSEFIEFSYNNMFSLNHSKLKCQTTQINSILNLLKNCDINICGKFLKNSTNVLVISIMQIYNIFIRLSCFPKDYKVVKLKSLYKRGTKTDHKKIRPIPFLSIVSKIIEKVIHNQTMNY